VTRSTQCASLAVVLLWLIPYAASQDHAPEAKIPSGTSVATVVSDLGRDAKDLGDLERIKFLARQPAEAAGLLVQELRPVAAVRILGNEHSLAQWRDAEHVVWCLRALRSLTGGLDFRAETTHVFGDTEIEENREWFTGGEQFPKDRTVHFFGVWMSRDSLYIAPEDAQRRIIQMWKSWYKGKGKDFAYPPFRDDPDIWYF
jgi:hypothetical protein